MGTLQAAFREHYPAYAAGHRLPRAQRRAAERISACRTAALGGHLQGCACGCTRRVQYHSCRHRLCPQCAARGRAQWLEAECARLLPCAHHHVVFTVPHELEGLWRYNRADMTQALFGAASETLKQLLGDARYLGAEPGMLLALHTWSRALALHPHIHALVSDGGLGPSAWTRARRSHFLPARVVMALFRGKLIGALRARLAAGTLTLPPALSAAAGERLLNRLGRKKWNVRVCPPYAHGEGVLRYLARYVRGGPLKDSQLIRAGAHAVAFRYRPHDAAPGERERVMRLAPDAFLARYLAHTPVPGQHQVRRYGLYAPRRAAALAQARALLGGSARPSPTRAAAARATPTWQDYLARFARPAAPLVCAHCGGPIGCVAHFAPARSPP